MSNRIFSILLIAATVSLVLLAGCTSSGKTEQPNANAQPPAPVQTVETPKSQGTTPTEAPVVAPKQAEPKPITPVDCNPLKDKTCATLAVGQEALVDNQLKLKVSNIKIQHCEKDYAGGEPEDYLVFDVDMENIGNEGTVYAGSNVFYALDSERNQREGSILGYAYGISYKTEECKNSRASALETSNLVSGSRSSGKVWIELKKPFPAGESYIVYKALFENKLVFFKFNAS